MYCPKCGEKLKGNPTHCKKCGNKLKNHGPPEPPKAHDRNKILIIALIVVVIALVIGVLYAGGVLNNNVPLENRDFQVFTMDVPVGSNLKEFVSSPPTILGGFIMLENVGEYSKDFYMLGVSNLPLNTFPDEFEFDRKEGDILILKDKTGQTNLYYVTREVDGFTFDLMGTNPDLLVQMIKTIRITDANGLRSQSSSANGSNSVNVPTSTPSTPAPTSSTPSSISILGGSFSTGSADTDKTYARINVGTAHAGENVIVQIFYSRDGKNLNNGNMVPATVHSDGYLEITSAEAYSLYPDQATIKIYDTNNKLLTSKTIYLSTTSGTQTF